MGRSEWDGHSPGPARPMPAADRLCGEEGTHRGTGVAASTFGSRSTNATLREGTERRFRPAPRQAWLCVQGTEVGYSRWGREGRQGRPGQEDRRHL